MKIEGPGKAGGVSGSGKIGKSSGKAGEFSRLIEGEEPASASSVSGAQSVSGVDSLLALQEVDDATERKGRAKKRANNLLDELDGIRHGLLMGEIPPHQLHLLKQQIASQRPGIDDPKLLEILDEIELRAEVELAKLEMGNSQSN